MRLIRWFPAVLGPSVLLHLGCHGGVGAGIPTPSPAFTLSISPASLSIPAGSGGAVTLSLNRTGGFAEGVAIDLQGAPSGVSGAATVPAGVASAQLYINVAATVPPQTLGDLSIKGTAGGLVSQVPLSLVVAAAFPPGTITPNGLQASGGPQANGGVANHALAMELYPAIVSHDAAAVAENRSGFHPSPSYY